MAIDAHRWRGLICTLTLLMWLSNSGFASDPDAPFVKIKRASLWVPDLERAILFYRDVLGFTVDSISDLHVMDDPVVHDLFNSDSRVPVRGALLSSSTEKRALYIMEAANAPQVDNGERRDVSLVMQTNDLAALVSRAKHLGFGIGAGNNEQNPQGGTFSERVIIGPGGQAVLVYQFGQNP